jgi:transposase-like protein
MQMVVQGVSTRRVKKITDKLCGERFAKSTVSRLTGRLDEQVSAWAGRELPEEIPFLIADAMQLKVRRQGAVRSTTALIVVGVTEEGQREILGFEVTYGATRQAWKDLLQQLRERGLKRIELATTDGRTGLEQAIRAAFPGSIWCRCHAHFTRNVLEKTPSAYKKWMHQLLGRMLEAHSPQEAQEVFDAAYEEIAEQAPKALAVLEAGLEDAIAVLALPAKYRRRLRTTNMLERLIEELRRREKVIRIFPNMESAWRLVGALLAEYHKEWSTGRKYLRMDEYFEWRASLGEASLDETEQDDAKQTIAA